MTGFDDVIPIPTSTVPTLVTNPVRLWIRRRRNSLTDGLGWLMESLGVPGAIQPFEIYDELTGQHVKVRVSARFTVIQVNGRDYYFYRYTGRFDGTGMGCS